MRASAALSLGHDEEVGAGLPGADRLLLDAADRLDAAVEPELAGHDDAPALVDLRPELVDDVERERQARRRAADRAGVDGDLER